ncbi:serine/threonine protein kinase [Micromonospora pattaloongensis]|uniref:non-specific serine/threonine protein kinase n=1 Tax=Micromonospora pattaloongensis TaxID=405436 RepID=A0A1H3R917_9ACTN|nr:serine/threonine-protein kinase [Micromonospora pattaloongensis]SDZ22147.1 serine/threonine protein kinase [Micromonospora pattaloongensis]
MFTSGLRLHERYTLAEQIGQGGMSDVWRAVDELLGRPVAVKALAPTVDPALRAATRREARAAARLTHPHVTQVYDYGEATLPGGEVVPYLVMELVEGRNLAERLEQGPLPWPAATRVAAQVATGLAAAHRLGVVHRDIKPGNVMLTATGVKILDFGIAALTDGAPDPDRGWLVGTPAYAAPERLRHGAAHPATDVYALGALLYECLAGQLPIPVNSWAEAADAHQDEQTVPPPAVAGLPPAVAELCLACLARDPEDRPRAEELAAALNAALGVVTEYPDPAAGGRHIPHQQPRTVPDRPVAASAGGSLPRPRFMASAPVTVASPPTDPEPAYEPYLMEDDAPRSRLATVVVAGGVIAAGLSVIIASAAFLSTPQTRHGAPTTPAGTPPAASAPAAIDPSAPGRGPSPTSPGAAVDAIDSLLAEALAARQIDEDSVRDLRRGLTELRDRLGEGRELRRRVEELRRQIDDRRRAGTIPSDTAARLDLLLLPLLLGAEQQRENND